MAVRNPRPPRVDRGMQLMLVLYYLTYLSPIFFFTHGYVTFAGEKMHNLDLSSELMTFEQGDIFIMPHLL